MTRLDIDLDAIDKRCECNVPDMSSNDEISQRNSSKAMDFVCRGQDASPVNDISGTRPGFCLWPGPPARPIGLTG